MRCVWFGALMGALFMTGTVRAQSTGAGPILTVTPSSAPNVFGSPSWSGYLANALSSLENGSGNIGNRLTDPTAYEIAGTVVNPGDLTVSGFKSWRGLANPPPPFDGEFGNRLHFGLHIVSDVQFHLANLVFNLDSTDSGNVLDFAGTFATSNYSPTRIGIDWVDGIKGNGDDITYTAALGTTAVNELIYVGVGNAFDATFEPGLTNQDKLDGVFAYTNSEAPFDVNMTYTLRNNSGDTIGVGTASVTVAAVPEPTSLVMGSIFATLATGLTWTRRRRRK